ncbi:hypothetical protein BH10ACT11_BH10ACT11_06730 [soil metagenome]
MSESRLRKAALVLAGLGIAVAGYLTWVHYEGLETVCLGGGGGCERVQSSDYASIGGVPVALLGLIGYVSMLALLARGRSVALLASGLGMVMLGFSIYLTYLELFVIDAICQWCVLSAVIATLLGLSTTLLALRAPDAGGGGRSA